MKRPSAYRYSGEIGCRVPAENANEMGTATRPAGNGNNAGPCNHCRHGDHQRCHIPYCWGCRHDWPMGSEQR